MLLKPKSTFALNILIFQLGITSTKTSKIKANLNKCAQPDSPDIYTGVSHYIDWIEKTIKDN